MATLLGVKTTIVFFDDALVRRMEAKKRRALLRIGAFGRTVMKRSFRKRKGSSTPPQPPYSHVGLLRDLTLYAYESSRESVVVGPKLLRASRGTSTVPQLLNEGGTVRRQIATTGGKKLQVAIYRARPFASAESPAFAETKAKMPGIVQDVGL